VTDRIRFWLMTLLAVASIVLTLLLGRWQLTRAGQKETLQAAIEAQAKRPPILNAELVAQSDAGQIVHRTAKVSGTWAAAWTVFLDNRQMNAKPGFYVLTPFLIEGTRSAVLVQRGWVARNFVDRTSVPTVPAPAGIVQIEGRIAPPPSKLYELGGPESGPIRQNLDLAQFRQASGLPLLPVSIQQTGQNGDGLLRDWPLVASSADKNYGYAFQWFGLSALIFFLYVWFQIAKRFIPTRRA
jgi:surfeit locus 1 family protein